MSDKLVTVARFTDPMQAALARSHLQAAGIRAFLLGESITAIAWHLTNAVGGIRMQVANEDAERANAILSEPAHSWPDASDHLDSAASDPDGDEQGDRTAPFEEPSFRDEIAERAFRSAALSWFFPPFHLYTFWLLVKVIASDERMSRRSRNRAIYAALIILPIVLAIALAEVSLLFAQNVVPLSQMPWNFLRAY